MSALAAIGCAIAALAYGLLAAWALLAWRRRQHVGMLAAACGASALFFGAVLAYATGGHGSREAIELLELGRIAAWLALLLAILHVQRPAGAVALRIAGWTAAVMLAGDLLPHWLARTAGVTDGGSVVAMKSAGRVLAAVAGMVLVEQLFRTTPADGRWSVKHACLGIGAVFAYDFYLYSNAMLMRQVDAGLWHARSMVDVLTMPFVALAFAREPRWLAGIALSQRMALHSTALLGAACYMLVMASAGYYIRHMGGEWGSLLQAVFLAGAALLLLAILSSGTLRAWLRVFIAKHFYHYRYDYREEWLRFTRALSGDGPPLSERVVGAVAALVESPGGSLWLRTPDGYRQAACWNAPGVSAVEPAGSPFAMCLAQHQWIVDVDAPGRLPAGVPALPLPGWLAGSGMRLAVPLLLRNELTGFIVLARPRSDFRIDWEVFDLLRVASSQAASHLAEQQAAEALSVARQFESFNRMSAFIVHDLKNVVSQLSLMLANAERHHHKPEFQEELRDALRHSVQRMTGLLQRVQRPQAAPEAGTVRLDDLVRRVVAEKSVYRPRPSGVIVDAGLAVLADAATLSRVVGHLVQNAVEATPGHGNVCLTQRRCGDHAVLEVRDTGAGMSESFIRERLFRPFQSTKPHGMGIGVFESRTTIQELGGTLDVESVPGQGTTFRIRLPLHRQEEIEIGHAA